jgi:hypothetical protein
MSDVLTLCSLLRHAEDLEGQMANALLPPKKYVAHVSYENRSVAKEHGLRFCKDSRSWKSNLTSAEAAALPFKVVIA